MKYKIQHSVGQGLTDCSEPIPCSSAVWTGLAPAGTRSTGNQTAHLSCVPHSTPTPASPASTELASAQVSTGCHLNVGDFPVSIKWWHLCPGGPPPPGCTPHISYSSHSIAAGFQACPPPDSPFQANSGKQWGSPPVAYKHPQLYPLAL